MFGKGGAGGDDWAANQARQDEINRQNSIRSGTSAIDNLFNSQFTDDFYGKRAKAYTDYATPQLQDQYADAQKQLTYYLDRNGTLDSSARAGKEGELQKLYDLNVRGVNDKAQDYNNTARTNIADARSGLINQLSATGDAQGAVSAATARATALSAPDTYSPLVGLFSSFTNALGTQARLEQASAYTNGLVQPRYNTGLFGTSNAVKVSG